MKKRWLICLAVLVAFSTAGSAARAEFRINELLFNPPGGDDGQEYLEILSDAPSASLDGVWFVSIDGDGGAGGTIDQAINLGGFSTGSNGLFLLRDAAATLLSNPNPATNVAVRDFAPDIENGTITNLLVRGFTGAVGYDLDSNNDGVVDAATPWASILDGFSWKEPGGGSEFTYFDAAIQGLNPGGAFGDVGFTAEAYVRLGGGTPLLSGITNTSAFPGPYRISGAEYASAAPFSSSYVMTPGSANVEGPSTGVVPEPSSVLLVGISALGALSLGLRRRLRASA